LVPRQLRPLVASAPLPKNDLHQIIASCLTAQLQGVDLIEPSAAEGDNLFLGAHQNAPVARDFVDLEYFDSMRSGYAEANFGNLDYRGSH
jgi:hypothetical protein